jgi:endopeptidase Clp ATP-binding regulatory subunit ClpX
MGDSDDSKKPPKSVEEVQKELQDFIKDKFGGNVMAFPMGPGGMGAQPSEELAGDTEDEVEVPAIPAEALSFDMTPRQVKSYLDRYVIGQGDAKRTLAVAICDHYNHVRRSLSTDVVGPGAAAAESGSVSHESPFETSVDYVKQNLILLGPTGVGKTYLVRILAQLIGVPFVKADVTKFSETGYVGGDVEDLVRELVRTADGNVQLASHGIVFLDEVDKIASARTAQGRDPSGRGVQVGLLKLMEETEVSLRSPMDLSAQFQDMMQMRKGGAGQNTINTKHILFVVSGAFSGIAEIIEKRLSERNVGFGAAAKSREPDALSDALLPSATTKDFVEYGFEPEFIGRLPVRVALNELDADDLYRILATSEGSILRQYRQNFADYGIEIAFEDDALRAVAREAADEKTGARGLMSVLERCLREFKFYLPGGPIRRLAMTTDVVDDPKAALEAVRGDGQAAESVYWNALVREFENEFARRNGVKLSLDEEAVGMAVTLAGEIGVTVKEYLWTTFDEHVDFLRKIVETSGKTELPVTPQVLSKPGSGLEVWM